MWWWVILLCYSGVAYQSGPRAQLASLGASPANESQNYTEDPIRAYIVCRYPQSDQGASRTSLRQYALPDWSKGAFSERGFRDYDSQDESSLAVFELQDLLQSPCSLLRQVRETLAAVGPAVLGGRGYRYNQTILEATWAGWENMVAEEAAAQVAQATQGWRQGQRPAVPVPTLPAASKPNAAGAASADKLALDKVLTALQASESDLPPPLLELMQQFQEQDTKSEAKHLHKVVASQAAAKRELAKLRTSRTAYLQAWNTYVEQVMTTLQQQVTEHGTTMAEFQEKETQWEAALQDSTSTLAKMTQDGGVETVSDSDMESQENKVEAAIEAEAKARSAAERAQSQNQALIQAMEQVKTAAAEELKKDATDTNRERTPRRKAAATEPTQQNSGKAP
ncbi:hypothetical protein AK812_SmicGene5064 [Symbiodinium microadriaticum]|uniref:Uncharacterized protein n=1 Tax=Symbiodinium microadriaticum TaxID=2951 RepID=A0A1Q9EUN5_SYMMI|nr:hypothetical protein AK812_SmicGene5064 [Symbiodinium microadriaticum]